MSAVWTAAHAVTRRRRVQTGVIAVVVAFSSAAAVVALGLLQAASAPFDRTFAAQHGAQITATFAPAAVSEARLARTAGRPAVQAAAGPYAEAVIDVPQTGGGPNQLLTVVGRADPRGPVDQVDLWAGHWVTGPGQIVLDRPPGRGRFAQAVLGTRIAVPGTPPLTVVGLASSLSQTADAWVAPGQISALRPTAVQMLYRFTQAATTGQLRTDLAAVTAGLPPRALLAWQSYLTIKQDADATAGAYVPFLAGFALLGLAVALLVVANVVAGAVLTRLRDIGLLKAVGFTPGQVVATFLAMIAQPALVGCVLGTALGDAAALILLPTVFTGTESGLTASLDPWADVITLAGMPALVLLTTLIPTRRARRLSAAEAIRAAGASRSARAPRIQRHLARTRFPRSVSLRLGLAMPIARPARSALTAAAVVLGVGTVTLAIGLSATMSRYGHAAEGDGAIQTIVYRGDPATGQSAPRHSDTGAQALLSALPGAEQVTALAYLNIRIFGSPQTVTLTALRGRPASPAMAHAADLDLPPSMLDVWHATTLIATALTGIAIAVLGALIPARSAARLTTAAVLHTE